MADLELASQGRIETRSDLGAAMVEQAAPAAYTHEKHAWEDVLPAVAHFELVDRLEVDGFDDTLLTDREVAGFVRETLPPSHLAECPSVQYEPDHPEFVADPYCLAFFQPWDHEIRVGPAERFEDAENMLETITHELGHNVHANIMDDRPDLATQWEYQHIASWGDLLADGMGFVSEYATTNVHEDFAESYRVYVHNPELLQFVSPDKYEFLRTEVFAGREYVEL